MRHRLENSDIHYKSGFKNCEISDFELLEPENPFEEGPHKEEKKKNEFSGRFCPDIEKEFHDKYFVKNAYTNTTERVSYMIEMSVCNQKQDPSC